MPLLYPLVLSAALFGIGLYGVLARRNAVLMLLGVELMLNAVNLNLVAFDAWFADQIHTGQVLTLFTITLAAAEIGLGLAIVLALFRAVRTVDVDEVGATSESPLARTSSWPPRSPWRSPRWAIPHLDGDPSTTWSWVEGTATCSASSLRDPHRQPRGAGPAARRRRRSAGADLLDGLPRPSPALSVVRPRHRPVPARHDRGRRGRRPVRPAGRLGGHGAVLLPADRARVGDVGGPVRRRQGVPHDPHRRPRAARRRSW